MVPPASFYVRGHKLGIFGKYKAVFQYHGTTLLFLFYRHARGHSPGAQGFWLFVPRAAAPVHVAGAQRQMCGVCAAGPALRCRAGPPCSLVLLYHGPFFCYTIHTAKMDVCANYACIPAYRSRPKKKGGRRTRHRPPGKGGTQGGQRHAACPAAGEKLTEPAGCTGMRPRPQPARRHTPGSTGCRRSCSFPARAGAAKSAGPSPQYPAQPSRCWAAARSF